MAIKKTIVERMVEFKKEKEKTGGKKTPGKEEGTTLLAFRVPQSWPKKLKLWTLERDTTVQALCNEILEREFKKLGIL